MPVKASFGIGTLPLSSTFILSQFSWPRQREERERKEEKCLWQEELLICLAKVVDPKMGKEMVSLTQPVPIRPGQSFLSSASVLRKEDWTELFVPLGQELQLYSFWLT